MLEYLYKRNLRQFKTNLKQLIRYLGNILLDAIIFMFESFLLVLARLFKHSRTS